VAIVSATRHPEQVGQAALRPYVGFGASPRGSINLVHAARALALLRGRRYVIPQDIAELAPDVLRHRIVPSFAALAEEVTPDAILARILRPCRPTLGDGGAHGMTVWSPRVRTPARPGPGPTPEALLRALDLTIGRRIHGLVAGEFRAMTWAVAPSSPRSVPTSPATTSAASTGT